MFSDDGIISLLDPITSLHQIIVFSTHQKNDSK